MSQPTRHYLKIADTDGEAFPYYADTEDEMAAITLAILGGAPFILMKNGKGNPTLLNTAHIVVAVRMAEADL